MHNIRIRRQRLILFGMTLILALLATRIAYLKIVKGEEYENEAAGTISGSISGAKRSTALRMISSCP